jgi:hypothetical protein
MTPERTRAIYRKRTRTLLRGTTLADEASRALETAGLCGQFIEPWSWIDSSARDTSPASSFIILCMLPARHEGRHEGLFEVFKQPEDQEERT